MGSFFARIDELSLAVGHGDLAMRLEVDQVYAAYQEFKHLNHPRGGQDHALRDSLYENVDSYLETLARDAVTEDGSDLVGAAIRVVDRWDGHREAKTPILYFNLVRSGHRKVQDEGAMVYDRPPDVHRLSEAELRGQRKSGHRVDYGANTRPRLWL